MPGTLYLRIRTLALAITGAGLFWWLGLPLPFLFGPLCACLLAALTGLPVKGMSALSLGARTVLGVAAGASVTPDLLHAVPAMTATVAMVPLFLLLIALTGVPYFRALGYDPATAWYAAMPGSSSDMVILGQEAGGDVRALSLIQATRVLFIVTLVPFLVVHVYGRSLGSPVGEPAVTLPPREILLMGVAALGGWWIARRVNLFGATILGPLIATVVLTQLDLLHHRPPREAILTAQLFVGLGIGMHYVGTTLAEIRRFVVSGMIYVGILAVLAAAFAEAITMLGLAPPLEAFLAFAPGGQSEMTVLSLVTGADLSFVIVHHLVRLILVIVCAPLAGAWLMRRDRSRPDDD